MAKYTDIYASKKKKYKGADGKLYNSKAQYESAKKRAESSTTSIKGATAAKVKSDALKKKTWMRRHADLPQSEKEAEYKRQMKLKKK